MLNEKEENANARPFKGKSIRRLIDDYTVIDLETTGLSTKTCEIIELAAIKVRDGSIVDTFCCLVQPSDIVPNEIIKLTGITNEMLINAPQIDEVFKEFLDFIDEDVILGHNIDSYDMPIIRRYCEELNSDSLNNATLDTLKFARKCDIDVPNHKLTTLTEYFNIEHNDSHRALSDCIANHECYQCLKEFYNPNIPLKKSSDSHRVNSRFSDETKQLQELNGIVMGLICDNILTEGEILFLDSWIKRNERLSGNYPFDMISKALNEILEDNIITNEEKADLLNILSTFADPVDNCSEACTETICLSDKQIVLTGDFNFGGKSEVTKKLETFGAIVKNGVSGKTDYVIVGSKGSENWSCGNYGSKVKKALELQAQGKDIKIIKEEDLFKCLEQTV